MASIHRHPESRYYQAAYVDADGRRVYRSTKQTNHSDAWRVALTFEDAAREARHGNVTAAQMRKVIGMTLKNISGESPVLHTIADWCRSWVADKSLTRSPGTGQRYAAEMEEFLEFLGPQANRDISQLNKGDIQRYRDSKLQAGISASSANLALKMLRSCISVAVRQELLTSNPAMAIDLLPKGRTNKRPLTREEVGKILAAADDDEWVGVIKYGYYIGARLSNAAKVRWEEIQFEQNSVTYSPVKQRTDREEKTLQVPLHPDLLEYLLARRKSSGPVFPRLSKLTTGGKTGLSLTFRDLLDKAGITYSTKAAKGKRGRRVYAVGYHSLRHSFNSDLANLGVSQELRQKLIGHASQAVNDGYTHVELDTLRDAIYRLPRLEER
jgi:integrase